MIRGSGVRSAVKSLAARRFVSTANSQTKYATLSNGVTVATESNPHAESATLGLWYTGGSRSEHPYSNGVSALTTNLLATKSANGILFSSENGKEFNGVIAQTTNDNAKEAAKAIGEIASSASSVIGSADAGAVKAALIAEAAKLEATPSKMVLEHLNATAFQGYSLALPTLGTTESISGLETQDYERFLD